MEDQQKQMRDGANESLWQQVAMNKQTDNAGKTEMVYDTLIVGGGITGITTALLLQRSGQKCILIEAAGIGFGTTGGTSAHLNTFFDATYPEIESDFGQEAAKLVAESGKEAMSIIKSFVDQYQIDCDLEVKDGYLFSENEKESKQLMGILESSRKAGIEVTEHRDNDVPVQFHQVIRFRDQGQFHPLKYINALADQYRKLGGIILEHTFVDGSSFEDEVYMIKAGNLFYKSRNLFYATHTPPGINVMNFACAPYRSYVLGVKLRDDDYPKGLSYDMQEPYHYFRTHAIEGEKYLIIGGEDHKTGHGEPEMAFNNLETYVRSHYNVASIAYQWSSQYYVPVDGLPYIGKLPLAEDRTYVATGFNGNGMMFGTLSAKIISDQILGVENRYGELFSPSRIKPVAGFSEFVKENADVAWHFVADRFSAEELDAVAELKYGEGIVAELKGERVAVYKDENGKITILSPTCTHAGCIVKFNPSEKSWDCPCHGGRYDTNGKVITGPPRKNLENARQYFR